MATGNLTTPALGPSTSPLTTQFSIATATSSPANTATVNLPTTSSPDTKSSTGADTTTVIPVVTTVSSGPNDATTLTITSTSSFISNPAATALTTGATSLGSSLALPSASNSGLPDSNGSSGGGGGGGLSSSSKVVVAVVVPVVGVALIAVGMLIFWKRRQRGREAEEARRKEVEEYGYNPNTSPSGGLSSGAAGSSNGEDAPYDMAEIDGEGYRGWGSTNGGKKVSTNMGSSVGSGQPISPVGMAFSDGGHSLNGNMNGNVNGYTGMAISPSVSTFPASTDGNVSNAPLIGSPNHRPETADSSIGVMAGPVTAENTGVHRGISNASSNYSAVTHSDHSDVGVPASHHEPAYYGADGAYDDGYGYTRHQSYQQYPEGSGYGMAPVIRDVQARRNTRIETPTNTHYPQQGNSGIAQNF